MREIAIWDNWKHHGGREKERGFVFFVSDFEPSTQKGLLEDNKRSHQQILWRVIKELFWCLAASMKLCFSTKMYKIMLQPRK